MKHIFSGLFIVGFLLPVLGEEVLNPARQFKVLLEEYQAVSGGMRGAKTDLQRKQAVVALAPFPRKFFELARQNPKDPIALKSLVQAVQVCNSIDSAAQIVLEWNKANFAEGGSAELIQLITEVLLRDHLHSEELGLACERIRYGYRLEYESFLETVIERSPHQEVRAVAILSKAQFLKDRLRVLQLTTDRPELEKGYKKVFGENYFVELQQRGRAEIGAEVELLFEKASTYRDVKTSRSEWVSDIAKSELFGLRNLSVGQEAPEIEGRDQDDKVCKLSDYRGKVVLLYFWLEF